MRPLDQHLVDGLGAMSTQDALPPPPAPAQAAPPPGLLDLYLKHKAQGLSDTEAALAASAALRKTADIRSSLREAGATVAGRPYDAVSDRASLMGEADRPMQELAAKRANGPLAAEEVDRQQKAAMGDIGMRAATGLLDPAHPTNVAARAAMAKLGMTPPPNLTVPTIPKDLWETLKPLADVEQKRADLAQQAPKVKAETAKTQAEAGSIAGPQAAKTAAEAEKASAEAAVERQKVGGQVAPGWVRSGTVAGVGDKEIEDFRNQATEAANTDRITKDLLGLLGGSDFVADPKKRARAAILSSKLLSSAKTAMGIRGLPAQDVKFLQTMTGDLSAGNLSNLVGYTKNPVRLQELNANTQAEVETRAKTLGLTKAGGKGPAAEANVQMRAPDGSVHVVPASKVEAAKAAGGKLLSPGPDAVARGP